MIVKMITFLGVWPRLLRSVAGAAIPLLVPIQQAKNR